MGSIRGQSPISLRVWPSKDRNAVPLSSLISRINDERGSFRAVTEESLREELNQAEAGAAVMKDEEEHGEEEVNTEEPDRIKELAKAREEVLGQLEQAHNSAMVTLDFVSLLLSKDTPVQAGLSISPALRDAVALGTLGADKVHESKVSKSQRDDIRAVAKGWKLQNLTEAANSVLASALRLQNEIEMETKYWEQVLLVDEKGWAICRLPQERYTLGVRFGFAESAPAFNNRSLGALRRNVDGTIYLSQGAVDSMPKRVRVRIQSNDVTVGESPPGYIPDTASIESSILQARNTIYEEELWQELNREARILASQGVRLIEDEIVLKISSTKRIVLDLQAIEGDSIQPGAASVKKDDSTAEVISLSLHLLLSYAHRQNFRRRSQPPAPISNRPLPNYPYHLLRPILARLHHDNIISTLDGVLAPLSSAITSTGLCDSSYTLITPMSSNLGKITSSKIAQSVPERITESLISNLSAEFSICLPKLPLSLETQSLIVRTRTAVFPLETLFQITISGPLTVICKPPPNPSSVEEVKGYLLWATSCALAGSFSGFHEQGNDITTLGNEAVQNGKAPDRSNVEGSEGTLGTRGWLQTHNPTILRKAFQDDKDHKEISFKTILRPGPQRLVEISATYKYISDPAQDVEGEGDGRPNGIERQLWRSTCLSSEKSVADDGIANENNSLRHFVEDVGSWNRTARWNSKNGVGDGYDYTESIIE